MNQERPTRGATYTRAVTTPKGWYRIGDAALLVGVDEYILRYWEEKFGALIGVRRSACGQRWYTPEMVNTLKRIRELLWVELYTIAGAKRQLRLAAERLKAQSATKPPPPKKS